MQPSIQMTASPNIFLRHLHHVIIFRVTLQSIYNMYKMFSLYLFYRDLFEKYYTVFSVAIFSSPDIFLVLFSIWSASTNKKKMLEKKEDRWQNNYFY